MARGLDVWRRRTQKQPHPLPEQDDYCVKYSQDRLWLGGAVKDQAEVDEVIFALKALREFLPAAIRQDNPNETEQGNG